MCWAPCDESREILPIPENYNPDDYEHDWCNDCAWKEQRESESWVQITRDMALDAQDPSLEGQWTKW